MTKTHKIIAIGGGEIGRAGYSVETLDIDHEIIRLTGKKHPHLLFLPTASGDAKGYVTDIQKHFGQGLGCKVEALYLIKNRLSLSEIRTRILSADIIYVGGGNTLRMMRLWRKSGVDRLLIEAYQAGKVMAGVSAGSICWFHEGNSDSRKAKNPAAPLIKVRGLSLIGALHCPHYDLEVSRRPELKTMMRKTAGVAIAIDNCCALEVVGDKYRIISSKDSANAYKVYWKRGKYFEEQINKSTTLRSISRLLSK